MAETGSWLPLNLMNFGIDDVLEWKVQTCGCELMKLFHTIDFHKDQGGGTSYTMQTYCWYVIHGGAKFP